MAGLQAARAEQGVGGGNGAPSIPFPSLRRIMRAAQEPEESCELCNAPIPAHPRHEHLYEPGPRQIVCSCTACALLFPADAGKRFRRVGRRIVRIRDFAMTDAQWEALALPVNMAFLHTSAPSREVHAFYPSPAGAMESLLTLEGWSDLVAANPILEGMQPDVEALLVNRVRDARDYLIAPIDRCYELVGLIRVSWRGLGGGQAVWERIAAFFDTLRAAAVEKGAGGA